MAFLPKIRFSRCGQRMAGAQKWWGMEFGNLKDISMEPK